MSLIHSRKARPARKHRAVDRLAQCEQEVAALQQRLNDADALIMRQAARLTEMETENEQQAGQLQKRQDALINVGKDRDTLERYVHDLERQLSESRRRIDVRTWAEAAVTETQEIPVLPLHQAPFAATSSGRVRPSWAKDEEVAS